MRWGAQHHTATDPTDRTHRFELEVKGVGHLGAAAYQAATPSNTASQALRAVCRRSTSPASGRGTSA